MLGRVFFEILTMTIFWNPNPPEDAVTRYELLLSTAPTMAAPQVISVPPTVDPATGKVTHVIPNWNTAVTKFVVVKAVNAATTSAPSAVLRVGEPQAPGGLAAKSQ